MSKLSVIYVIPLSVTCPRLSSVYQISSDEYRSVSFPVIIPTSNC